MLNNFDISELKLYLYIQYIFLYCGKINVMMMPKTKVMTTIMTMTMTMTVTMTMMTTMMTKTMTTVIIFANTVLTSKIKYTRDKSKTSFILTRSKIVCCVIDPITWSTFPEPLTRHVLFFTD